MDTLQLPNYDYVCQINTADSDAPPRSHLTTKGTKAHSTRSPHIRFAPLPIVNHLTKTAIYPLKLRPPANGIIAQRRVENRDKQSEDDVAAVFRYWRRKCPKEPLPVYHEVRWEDEVHPGKRLQILIDDGEVSPRTAYAPALRAMRKLVLEERRDLDAEKRVEMDAESEDFSSRVGTKALSEPIAKASYDITHTPAMAIESFTPAILGTDRHFLEALGYVPVASRITKVSVPAALIAASTPSIHDALSNMKDTDDRMYQEACGILDSRQDFEDVRELSDDDDEDNEDYWVPDSDDEDAEGFYLSVPICGIIARRRAEARGEDFNTLRVDQLWQRSYETRLKRGEFDDVNRMFRDVDWNPPSATVNTDGEADKYSAASPTTKLPFQAEETRETRKLDRTLDNLEEAILIRELEMENEHDWLFAQYGVSGATRMDVAKEGNDDMSFGGMVEYL